MKKIIRKICGLLILLLCSSTTLAQGAAVPLPLLSLPAPMLESASQALSTPLVLATGAAGSATPTAEPPRQGAPGEEFRTPLITPNRLHEYLGFGSLIAAGLAALTPPEEDEDNNNSGNNSNDGFHHNAAVTAAVLGGLAVATGFLFHYDDIGPRYGLGDPDNQHMLLGLLGTLGYAVAVSQAPDGAHAAAGILGLASMAVAIKIEW